MSDYFNEPQTQNREQFRREYRQQQFDGQRQQQSASLVKWGVLGGAILIILLVVGSVISGYNSLVVEREKVASSWSQVQSQMQRRADLIPNLVETVKGTTKQEQEVFGRIADARAKLLQPNATPTEQVAANTTIDRGLMQVLALQENYPQLRSNESFLRLQDELAGSENRIAVARRDYINAVNQYNVQRSHFPTVLIANLLGFPYQDNYFKAEESAQHAPTVRF